MAKPSKQQQIQQLRARQRPHPSTEGLIVKLLASFVVAFKQIGVFLPIIAAAMTLLLYFFYPQLLPSWQQDPTLGGFFILSDGLLCALLIALVYALCSLPIVVLTNKGLQDYTFFKASEEQLYARLGKPVFESGTAATPQEEMTEHIDFLSLRQDSQKLAIYREACNCYFKLKETLYSPKAVQLLSNVGDVYALAMANRTQEMLIKIEAMSGVIEEAKQVYEDLQASSIRNRDELLKELVQAISVLDPQSVEGLYKEKSDNLFDNLRKKMRRWYKAPRVKTEISHFSFPPVEEGQISDRKNTRNSHTALGTEARMRAIIHFISFSLHRFQEDRLAEVLQARNNLVLATLASGLITYALLCVSIIAIVQNLPNDVPSSTAFQSAIRPVTSALASAVVIYTTGIAAGLFGRLYAEANKESATKDYGLSRARLQAIPLISGLAAIGGVFITTTTLATTTESAVFISAFTLNIRTILVAMIFGFTPNLLIRAFQQHPDQYVSNLASTEDK